MQASSARATIRFVFLDPLGRLRELPQRARRELRRYARRARDEFDVQPKEPVTVAVFDKPHECVPGDNVGGIYFASLRLIEIPINGAAYARHPRRTFQEVTQSFVHEYTHFLEYQVSGLDFFDKRFTLLRDIWEEMLTCHAECRIAGRRRQPHYTKAPSPRELARLMREMRDDLRKPAQSVHAKWRFPGLESPNHWAVYKVGWALGAHYLRDHTLTQAVRATPREMRRAYDELLAELSNKVP